jgi:Zn-dependent M16 (insulinase) family peptidase
MRKIIRTIARIDRPLTSSQKGNTAVTYYFEKTNREDIQNDRDVVLLVKTQDIKKMEKRIADILAQRAYSCMETKKRFNLRKIYLAN